MNKLKKEWVLLGNKDDETTRKKKLETKICKFSEKRGIKEKRYKFHTLKNDEESSLNVVKVYIYLDYLRIYITLHKVNKTYCKHIFSTQLTTLQKKMMNSQKLTKKITIV